eukprot:9503950-Pyramimonas_sp.AAC.1
MAAIDVLGASVVLWVVRQVDGRFVVDVDRRGDHLGFAELGKEGAQVSGLLRSFGGGHDLGLAAGQRDRGLFLGRPRDGRLIVDEHVTASGVFRGPVGIREADHWSCVGGFIA